jgi:protein tyrosine phosphatase
MEIYYDKEETIINKCIFKREFTIRSFNIERRVTQLHVINWPDHSSPEDDNAHSTIDCLINTVNEFKNGYGQSPVLVHCRYNLFIISSGGTGRTGTFIAIYNIVRSLNIIKLINSKTENKIKPFFSVFNTVRKLREQRIGMVTSNNQYKYIYEYIIDWAKRNYEFLPNSQ